MTDFFKELKNSFTGVDTVGLGSPEAYGINDASTRLSQQANQFDAKKLATDLSQQMLELGRLHHEYLEDPLTSPKAQQDVADKIRDEISPVWKNGEQIIELARAFRDQGAEVVLGFKIPEISDNPLEVELNPETREIYELKDYRNPSDMVSVSHMHVGKRETEIIVSGDGSAQSF